MGSRHVRHPLSGASRHHRSGVTYSCSRPVLEPTPIPTPEATETHAPLADTGSATDDTDHSTGTPVALIGGIAGAVAVALILTVVLIGRRRPITTASDGSEEG
jgi:hypothetical protein